MIEINKNTWLGENEIELGTKVYSRWRHNDCDTSIRQVPPEACWQAGHQVISHPGKGLVNGSPQVDIGIIVLKENVNRRWQVGDLGILPTSYLDNISTQLKSIGKVLQQQFNGDRCDLN